MDDALPGAAEFLQRQRRFLGLTNNSVFTRVTCRPGKGPRPATGSVAALITKTTGG